MIKLIQKSGVDAVKFQLADPHDVYCKDAFKANYQVKNTGKGSIEMSKKNQLKKRRSSKNFQIM